jgi:putative peptidoglycan lipid II flippase
MSLGSKGIRAQDAAGCRLRQCHFGREELANPLLPAEKHRSVSKSLKNIGVVSFLTIVSRVLGLLRDQLSAAIFGASLLNSAFITAFNLPNLFRRLLGEGSLTAAFLPTLQEELHLHGRPGAHALLNKVVSWLVLVTGGVVAVAMMLFDHARLMGGQAEKWYLAADLTVILFPYLFFVCVAAAFNATLNVFEHFTEPALSPIWLNLSMILTLGGAGLHWARTPMGEIHWLCVGVLIGGFLQMAVPAGVLIKGGWRPKFDFSLSPKVREIALLMAPGLFGTAIYQINIYVSRLLAFSLNDSAATLLFYANRLMELPIGVFAIAVSTVVYPMLARHAVAARFGDMATDFRKGVRLILLINVPAAAGLALLSGPIVRLLYQRGAFTEADARLMAVLLALFAIGMPFFSVVNLTVRAFYSIKDTSTPVKVALVDFLVNLGLSVVLMRWLGAAGLVLASTTAIIVQAVLLKRALTRRIPEMRFGSLLPSVFKIIVATAGMSVVVGASWFGLRHAVGGRMSDLLAVVGLIPLACATYAGLLWSLKIEGREELRAMLAARFGGAKIGTPP